MARNATMGTIGVLSVIALVFASVGWYRAFSFVAGAVILAVIATATIERGDTEVSLAPYTGLIGILAAFFLVGLIGIWLTWDPTVTEYSYVLGVPIPTLFYFGFIWFLPLTAAIYYAFLFDRIASDELVEDVIESARERQREEAFPLAPEAPADVTDRAEPGRSPEMADGGEVTDE